MIGKITTVLAKKEAEAYQDQGLHREARKLYTKLLSWSPDIDPAVRETIQSRISDIDQHLETAATQPSRPLTPQEIVTIRDGWGTRATATDILVCAQAFYQIGAWDQALEELCKLLYKSGPVKKIYVTQAADCLVRLHAPEDLPEAVDRLTQQMPQPRKIILAAQVAMTRHMEDRGHLEHALALYHHLKELPGLAEGVQPLLDDLSHRIQRRP